MPKIFQRIRNLPKAFRAGHLLSGATNRASEKKHAEALALLKALYRLFGTEAPTRKVIYEANLLCGNVAATVGDYDLSLSATATALRQLDGDVQGLSRHEKDYLRCYCRVIVAYCALKLPRGAVPRELLSYEYPDPRGLQRDKVRSYLLRTFPMRADLH